MIIVVIIIEWNAVWDADPHIYQDPIREGIWLAITDKAIASVEEVFPTGFPRVKVHHMRKFQNVLCPPEINLNCHSFWPWFEINQVIARLEPLVFHATKPQIQECGVIIYLIVMTLVTAEWSGSVNNRSWWRARSSTTLDVTVIENTGISLIILFLLTYIYTHTHTYIYIYIYREREREKEGRW